MPRFPHLSTAVSTVAGSVYSKLGHRLASYSGEVYPLHVGDTWMEPPVGCRMEDLRVEEYPGMHRYSQPHGLPGLLEALSARVRERTGLAVDREEILVTGGATGGLGAVVGALVDPGDEVLILAPFWPLIHGIVRSFHAVPVPVPFFGVADSPETAVETVERFATSRTTALYLSTPGNPSGRVIPGSWIEALVTWAESKGLWILSDEVYEDYVYEGAHTYARPLSPDRIFASHSFSKALGMAGNRCGYVVGPAGAMREVRKVSTHTFYAAPTAAQIAAQRALEGLGDPWIAKARELYAETGRRAAQRLGLEPPQGSTFLFLDVADHLDEAGLGGFLERCAEKGLFLAPGPSFGPYPTHVRLCYTSVPPEVVERGVEVLAQVLGR
jgi:N-succinyldiaminopimelate aminotransferase